MEHHAIIIPDLIWDLRLVLSWFLSTGQKLQFPTLPLSRTPIQRAPRRLTPDGLDPLINAGLLDPNVVLVLRDLQELVASANESLSSNSRLSGDKFQHPLATIQSRLLELDNEVNSITSECLRLGMLAFLTTMYQLPGHRLPYNHLNNRFRTSLRAMEPSTPELQTLTTWLVIIGLITVWDAEEPWLRAIWDNIGLESSWAEVHRNILCRFFWIPSIHNMPGKRAFDKLRTAKSVRS